MALPPIQFARRPHDPSLVQQAMVSLLTGVARKKLITDPAQRQYEEFLAGERGEREEYQTGERVAGEEAGVRAADVLYGRRKTLARLEGVDLPLEKAGRVEKFAEGIPVRPEQTDVIGKYESELGVDFADPTSRGGAASLIDRLETMTSRMSEQQRADQAGEQQRTDAMTDILYKFSAREIPPFLVKDLETGEVGSPSEQEISLKKLFHAIHVGETAELEGDERFTSLAAQARELEERVVPVPAYSPEHEAEWMGRISQATPGAQHARDVYYVAGVLQRAGLASSIEERGKESWFIDDAGVRQEMKNPAEFFTRFPAEARGRIKGALWAGLYFPDPKTFDVSKQQYNLYDPVAEDTYRQITGFIGAQTPTPQGGGEGEVVEAPRGFARAGREKEGGEPQFLSVGAQELAVSDEHTIPEIEYFADKFTKAANPEEAYTEEIGRIDAILALSDEELKAKLVEIGEYVVPQMKAGPRGSTIITGPYVLPERDVLRLEWYQLIEAARLEANERRKR